jgi:hypothetical protein
VRQRANGRFTFEYDRGFYLALFGLIAAAIANTGVAKEHEWNFDQRKGWILVLTSDSRKTASIANTMCYLQRRSLLRDFEEGVDTF